MCLPKPTLGYAPSTFLERGVWVPFTTPLLAGARIRPAERCGLELIIPNPSGGRGVYILPWDGVFALCTPTMHDRALNAAMEGLRGITPMAIRRLALDAAQGGLAGRDAASAARTVRDSEVTLVTITNFELLLRLIEMPGHAETVPKSDIEARAKRVVAAVGEELGRTADQVAAQLEELAKLYAPFGIGANGHTARLQRHSAALAAFRLDVAAALRAPPPLASHDADLILAAADLTLACVRKTVDDVLSWLRDVPSLLRRWIENPDDVAARLARPDWLLDGWERIALVWAEGQGPREPRLAALADLVPATPREVVTWVEGAADNPAGVMRLRRRVAELQDWRSGDFVLDLVAQGERLRALSPGACI